MQIFQSSRPAFRHRWRWGANGNLPSHLTATRVATFNLDPSLAPPSLQQRFESLAKRSKMLESAGAIELDEVGGRTASLLNKLACDVFVAAGLAPFKFMNDLEPQVALARDSVGYHHDMPLWMNAFGAWCLAGPERVLRFPMMDLEVPFKPGTLVVFDPSQPHGLLRPGQVDFDADLCTQPENVAFISFALHKEGTFNELLGCLPVADALPSTQETQDQYTVCKRTGHVEFDTSKQLACA